MKRIGAFIYVLLITFMFNCTKEKADVSAQNESYFIGSWKISKAVEPSIQNLVPLELSFKEGGSLLLNVSFGGATDPIYRWSYNPDTKQFSLFLPGEEKYKIIEISEKYFKVQHEIYNDQLLFTKK